jgi:hypothetical protein
LNELKIYEIEKLNTLFPVQLCVQIVGNKEDLVLGMKGNYIEENVMQLGKI